MFPFDLSLSRNAGAAKEMVLASEMPSNSVARVSSSTG
jgi:hypothetical protein